mmetsp:Transcript_6775/g.9891  ORF Transcript_6775/g.9891 Transcript_6775/m.9891 type:complete len:459 (+) Transcript_6775:166-1542(+)|eukprot:CAMPEP_0194250066 /NCGR_PEP_ID=MMETSP0158-20130606/22014_1 /TAXON_ID=33649 /ORGANISM="Thalassionema nitzschioides, Strain L26-B" /LENGTH=458 /DNA_ID=CAMNT_0038986745 /DNA_START=100 /DNA_END=1476 /DNA_ORIENTATION=-
MGSRCATIVTIAVVFILIACVAAFLSRSRGASQVREQYPYTTVLSSNQKLVPGDSSTSPNGLYELEFTNRGSLVLLGKEDGEILWRASNEDGASKISLQSDGNLVLRRSNGSTLWRSKTHDNPGAELRLDDGGQIAVIGTDGTSLWLAGLPRGDMETNSYHTSLSFPIRGAFYYPWYPETWSVDGHDVDFQPTLGKYHSSNGKIQREHVNALKYIHTEVAIASWFGPNTHNDRARLTNLMMESHRLNNNNVRGSANALKWTVYHEQEFRSDPSVDEIRADLNYLKKWYVWRDSWAYVKGKPVIFVYNKNGEDGCDMTERWMKASRGEWHVVLKVFNNDEDCPYQPDGWHQYGPSSGVQHHEGRSYVISPGFWRARSSTPKLPRYSKSEWQQIVQDMVDSNEPWQLIVSYNEWGEGTAVESAKGWETRSGYGFYMDVLHDQKTLTISEKLALTNRTKRY